WHDSRFWTLNVGQLVGYSGIIKCMDEASNNPKKSTTKEKTTERPSRPEYGPEHPRIRFLAMATLVIISLSSGFLGGWLAAKEGVIEDAKVEKERIILQSQGELLGDIAREVGQS